MSTDRDAYLEQLTLSLRVRDVPGPRIRELLDEVTTHLDDSGDAPRDAFGEPHRFAEALAAGHPVGDDPRPRRQERAGLIGGLLGAAGAIVLVELGFGLATGDAVTVTVGNLVTLVAIGVGLWLLIPRLMAGLDVAGPKAGVVGAVVAIWSAGLAARLLLERPLLTLADPIAAVVALGLLAAAGVRIRRSVDRVPPSRFGG